MIFSEVVAPEGYKIQDLQTEEYREYIFSGCVYRIDNPIALTTREGGTTHRIVDSQGLTHCVPAVGHFGCVIRWYAKNIQVSF